MPCFKRDIKVTWLVETGYIYIFSSLKIERSSMPCFKRDIKVTWLVETGYISIQFIKDRTLKHAMFQTRYKGDLVSGNRIYIYIYSVH